MNHEVETSYWYGKSANQANDPLDPTALYSYL